MPPAPSPERRRPTPDHDPFAGFLDHLQAGAYAGTFGPAGWTTLAANGFLRQMFGWDTETALDDVRPFDRERFVDDQARHEFLQLLARAEPLQGHVLRLRRLDASWMWVELTARATAAVDDTLRVDALLRDVTERKRLEDQGRDVYQQLLQTEKLASLGQTISGVAHELNNPLATILACAERLTSHRLDEQTRRDLDAIRNAADRAARIVRSLQTFARKRHTTRSAVDLNRIARDTVALRAYELRAANVSVVEALAAGLPPVFVDPHQVQQILLNLIINAEQAMADAHDGGTLILRSWHDPNRDAIVLEVNDDGPGVSDEVQAKIFDPFFTTKTVGKGTGLGLTVAYAIAREHGGQLTVKSHDDRGASFYLELPVMGGQIKAAEPAAAQHVPAVPKGTRLLVVEDEAALGDAIAASLSDEGFRVDRAANGEEALSRLRERHYDVIICDLKMPKVDGMAFFAEVSAKMPQVAKRLIFMTGDVAGTDAERFLADTGCRWIPKPFRLRDLVRVARDTLG